MKPLEPVTLAETLAESIEPENTSAAVPKNDLLAEFADLINSESEGAELRGWADVRDPGGPSKRTETSRDSFVTYRLFRVRSLLYL